MQVGRLEIKDEKLAAGVASLQQLRAMLAARESVGERFNVPRKNGEETVPVLVYRPEKPSGGKLPVFFNMHGGVWTAGDAMMMESFCQLLADSIPAVVVNINYHKADVIPILDMSREAADCARYFREHCEEYGIDPERMAMGGHSAGANITAGTALRLKEAGMPLKMQVLVYPCVDVRPIESGNPDWMVEAVANLITDGTEDDIHISPMAATDEELRGIGTAAIVVCGRDELRPHGLAYAKRLADAGNTVYLQEYPNAEHGFLEVNRPDFIPQDPDHVDLEQAGYARDCEQWLIRLLRTELNNLTVQDI